MLLLSANQLTIEGQKAKNIYVLFLYVKLYSKFQYDNTYMAAVTTNKHAEKL